MLLLRTTVGTITPSYRHFLAFIPSLLYIAQQTFQHFPRSVPLIHSAYHIPCTSSISCHLRPQVLKTCINQSYSNWAPVTSDVPQGSVLGPILFLININDLDTNIISKMTKFADDTKLWHRARNPYDIMELQEDINKLVKWANKWQMNFNVDKCSVRDAHRTQQHEKQL